MHIQSTVQKLSENEREGVLTHPITSHYAIINLSPHLLLLILNTTQPILHPQVADLSLAAHLDSLHQLLDWLRVKAHVGGTRRDCDGTKETQLVFDCECETSLGGATTFGSTEETQLVFTFRSASMSWTR